MTKLEAVQKYFKNCPYLDEDGFIDVNYLDDDVYNYSINLSIENPVYKTYADGGEIRQLIFYFVSTLPLDRAEIINNSAFGEQLADWIKEQNDNNNLPEIDGVISIECLSNGVIEQNSETTAIYSIQVRILYEN